VPVIPISKADFILTCNRCGAGYHANHPNVHFAGGTDSDSEKAVLVCPSCTGKMRVPSTFQKAIRVTCPHCRDQFTVTVSKA
jgi:DNA-directed RNA polymerase subunit RPC12/RpoP